MDFIVAGKSGYIIGGAAESGDIGDKLAFVKDAILMGFIHGFTLYLFMELL